MSLGQAYRDFRRLQQIANVLFKQEMGYFIQKLNLKSHLSFKKRLQKEAFTKPPNIPKRLRLAMEELSGAFVKLGQLLSLRADLVPEEYVEEFTKLQDEVKPFPFFIVKRIVETELKKPLDKLFSHFNKIPIAAASVGQVHEAILKNGKRVAVKVQRPKIKQMFETDIDIMYHLAHSLEKHIPETKNFNPTGIIGEFEKYTKKEMDYVLEGKNIEAYATIVKHDKRVKIPRVYWVYTTSKVLTMEFIEGVKISSIKDFKRFHVKGPYISNVLVSTFVETVLYHHFFHADPHPGNILLMKDKRIALLDFGIAGRLSPQLVEKIGYLFFGLVEADIDMIVEGFVNIGSVGDDVNKEQFGNDIRDVWAKYYDTSLNQIKMDEFFFQTMDLGRRYNLKFPTDYVLLMKTVITTEGVIQKIDPKFNFVKVGKPFFERYIQEQTKPEYILKNIKKTLLDFKDLFVKFPVDAQKILKKYEKEEDRTIDINDEDIKKFTVGIEHSTNRMTIGVMIAALIVASALLILANVPPYVKGLPLYSMIGLITVGILLIVLLISMFKERGGV